MRALLILVLAAAACAAPAACGTPKPAPVVPPGEVGCPAACYHVAAMPCGTSRELCERLCSGVARNDPKYPTCLSLAVSCAELNACGGAEDAAGPTTNGPGPGRDGP